MSDLIDRLLEEDWRHARLSEDRRIAVTSVNVVVASAIAVAVSVAGLSHRLLPATCWMIVLAGYGLVVCVRLEERAQFHTLRARHLRARSDEAGGERLEELLRLAGKEHETRYGFLSGFRLHFALLGIHLLMLLLGVALTVAASVP
jgi:hypothetical protein